MKVSILGKNDAAQHERFSQRAIGLQRREMLQPWLGQDARFSRIRL
jgi:hypothetical protein